MTAVFSLHTVYGKDLLYPVSESALLLCKLAGTKTMSSENVELLKQIGFDVSILNNHKRPA